MFKLLKLLFGAKSQHLMLLPKDQETKDKSVKLGVQGIILSVIGLIGVILFVLIATNLADNVLATQRGEGYQLPVMSLFGAITFYAFAFVFLGCVFGGISFSIYQKSINKRKFGKVAFAICLSCLAVAIVATILILVIMLQFKICNNLLS